MDLEDIKKQIKNVNNLLSEVNKQNVIFDNIIKNAIKGTEGKDQIELMRVQNLLRKSTKLGQEGKIEEVKTLIQDFKDGRKSRKSDIHGDTFGG